MDGICLYSKPIFIQTFLSLDSPRWIYPVRIAYQYPFSEVPRDFQAMLSRPMF